jgi:isopentenyldiphosphate isomerase
MAELIIELNDHDKQIGKRPIEEFVDSGLVYRSTALIILNEEGEMLIQKRKKGIELFPGLFNYAVDEAVVFGETFEACIERGMETSLGKKFHCVEVCKYPYLEGRVKSFRMLYSTFSDGPFRILGADMDGLEWITIRRLREDLGNHPERYVPSFVEGMRVYFEKYSDQVNELDLI